jgi:hypothetical protein
LYVGAAAGPSRNRDIIDGMDDQGHQDFVSWWGDSRNPLTAGLLIKQCTRCDWVGVRDSEVEIAKAAEEHTAETRSP